MVEAASFKSEIEMKTNNDQSYYAKSRNDLLYKTPKKRQDE